MITRAPNAEQLIAKSTLATFVMKVASCGGPRRPTLPRSLPRSTIGAGGLNFRVRNGTGCTPSAMTTELYEICV